MDNSIAVGIIAAGAAIFTLAVTKIFDFFFATKTHKFELKKEYFLKKLNAFEKATTYYTITHSSMTTIAAILNLMNNDDTDLPKSVIDDMLKKITGNLEKVQQGTQDSALALGLYTDFKFQNKDEILVSRYIDVLGQIGLKNMVLELLNNKVANTSEEETRISAAFDIKLEEILLLVSDIVGISNDLKVLYTSVTTHLREQIKKYED